MNCSRMSCHPRRSLHFLTLPAQTLLYFGLFKNVRSTSVEPRTPTTRCVRTNRRHSTACQSNIITNIRPLKAEPRNKPPASTVNPQVTHQTTAHIFSAGFSTRNADSTRSRHGATAAGDTSHSGRDLLVFYPNTTLAPVSLRAFGTPGRRHRRSLTPVC